MGPIWLCGVIEERNQGLTYSKFSDGDFNAELGFVRNICAAGATAF